MLVLEMFLEAGAVLVPVGGAVVLVPLALGELVGVPPVEALVVRRPEVGAGRRGSRRGGGRRGGRGRGLLAPAEHHPCAASPWPPPPPSLVLCSRFVLPSLS